MKHLSSFPVISSQSLSCSGLTLLENHLEDSDYLYVLKSLYQLTLTSQRKKESGKKLRQRLQAFEKSCAIPGCLSILPINQFIQDLENQQYLYPVSRRDVTFFSYPNEQGGD